jgi:ankyrin repeat protein
MKGKKKCDEALIDAVIANDAAAVQRLLEQGASPNYCEDSADLQPLHFAALYDAASVIPLLVMVGADTSAMTDCDDTPLSIAKRHGHEQVVGILSQFASNAGGSRH